MIHMNTCSRFIHCIFCLVSLLALPWASPAAEPAPAPQAKEPEYQNFVPRNNRNVQITIPDFLKNRK